MKRISYIILLICLSFLVQAQSQNKRALFLGNSYTAVNNLPQIVKDMATSTGDTLVAANNTPGGSTLEQHSVNATSLSLINSGLFDFVVLQEQSQRPSFPAGQVALEVFPYARTLDSLITAANPCTETAFYQTWGRKNGDASNCAVWPPVCTYNGMDSILAYNYRKMADDNNAILSPVGAVWKYIRQNHAAIELYDVDESHPSQLGSYAGAACFYTVIFRKDPTAITYDFNLDQGMVNIILNAVKTVVYDSLMKWNVGKYDPVATFTHVNTSGGSYQFTNTSVNTDSYHWNFGDGNTSSLENPTHTYTSSGNKTVTFTASGCGYNDESTEVINVVVSGINDHLEARIQFYPNPVTDKLTIKSTNVNPDDSYVIITNIIGTQMMDRVYLTDPIQTIDLSAFPSGIYFVNFRNQSKVVGTYKLIKN